MGNDIPAARHQKIIGFLKKNGFVRVEELSRILDVSLLTIRRDLDRMAEEGLLQRTHGGAVFVQPNRVELLYARKGEQHKEEKAAIGKMAASLVEDDDLVFINSGSTAYHVLMNLAGRPKVKVVTNNVAAVVDLEEAAGLEVILVGGHYRPESHCLVGSLSELILNGICATKAIIGADGISVELGITSPVAQEASVTAKMLERTNGQVIVIADNSKIGVVSNFVITPIENVDILVTNRKPNNLDLQDFAKHGVRVIYAD
ncbi:MAG: DeoR/GlpR transcriptional regulator [Spirochaetales bacterium]|nr:DeoR/GlpR transcriptional regulator [Spirochaetales bacterium]